MLASATLILLGVCAAARHSNTDEVTEVMQALEIAPVDSAQLAKSITDLFDTSAHGVREHIKDNKKSSAVVAAHVKKLTDIDVDNIKLMVEVEEFYRRMSSMLRSVIDMEKSTGVAATSMASSGLKGNIKALRKTHKELLSRLQSRVANVEALKKEEAGLVEMESNNYRNCLNRNLQLLKDTVTENVKIASLAYLLCEYVFANYEYTESVRASIPGALVFAHLNAFITSDHFGKYTRLFTHFSHDEMMALESAMTSDAMGMLDLAKSLDSPMQLFNQYQTLRLQMRLAAAEEVTVLIVDECNADEIRHANQVKVLVHQMIKSLSSKTAAEVKAPVDIVLPEPEGWDSEVHERVLSALASLIERTEQEPGLKAVAMDRASLVALKNRNVQMRKDIYDNLVAAKKGRSTFALGTLQEDIAAQWSAIADVPSVDEGLDASVVSAVLREAMGVVKDSSSKTAAEKRLLLKRSEAMAHQAALSTKLTQLKNTHTRTFGEIVDAHSSLIAAESQLESYLTVYGPDMEGKMTKKWDCATAKHTKALTEFERAMDSYIDMLLKISDLVNKLTVARSHIHALSDVTALLK